MIDRYRNMTRPIPVSKVTAPHVSIVVPKNCITLYGIPSNIMTESSPQLTFKFVAALCASVESKPVTTAECHPPANKQENAFNKTLVARLRHFIDMQLTNWDKYGQPLTYCYNIHVHCTIRTPPSNLVLSWQTPGALIRQRTGTLKDYIVLSPVQVRSNNLEHI